MGLLSYHFSIHNIANMNSLLYNLSHIPVHKKGNPPESRIYSFLINKDTGLASFQHQMHEDY